MWVPFSLLCNTELLPLQESLRDLIIVLIFHSVLKV